MSVYLSIAVAPEVPVEWVRPLSVREQLVAEWMSAREDEDTARVASLRRFARSVSRQLPDGFNYPAAA